MKLDECFKKGLLKRIPPDMDNAHRSIRLSSENIEDAEENLRIKRYRVVAILSYTAMFHAARAILFRDGVKERSHECIPVYLKEKYLELESLANLLDSYRRFRHDAIYGLDFAIDEEEARASLESSKEFLETIRDILNGHL
ncbi:MAG: HEPN domain-containing protein [Candidatus Methanoperedens sp.]|nr:HEPN domain-containing protein [Candidatus Methanoperedens sp.]